MFLFFGAIYSSGLNFLTLFYYLCSKYWFIASLALMASALAFWDFLVLFFFTFLCFVVSIIIVSSYSGSFFSTLTQPINSKYDYTTYFSIEKTLSSALMHLSHTQRHRGSRERRFSTKFFILPEHSQVKTPMRKQTPPSCSPLYVASWILWRIHTRIILQGIHNFLNSQSHGPSRFLLIQDVSLLI